jgi:hypothetical protein
MADVKQAAKWMQEGKKVHREFWAKSAFIRATPSGFFRDDRGEEASWLMVEDLLAEDWAVFEYIN